jgi:ribosomal protein S18 acetylase RimI-like enzyme
MKHQHDAVHIRQAVEADLPQIVAMDRAIFGAYGAQEEPAVICARLQVFPAGCLVLEEVAESDAERAIVGYLTTEKWREVREPVLDENPYTTHCPDGHIFNITTLAVNLTHQNRGLGKRLLDCAIAIGRREGCVQIILETAHARRFYERHGFEKVGERRQRGIHLQIMRLKLL